MKTGGGEHVIILKRFSIKRQGVLFTTVRLAGFPSESCLQASLRWRFWALSLWAHPWKPHAGSPGRRSRQDEAPAPRPTAHRPTPAAPRQDGGPDPHASSSGRGCHGAAPPGPPSASRRCVFTSGRSSRSPSALGDGDAADGRPPARPPSIHPRGAELRETRHEGDAGGRQRGGPVGGRLWVAGRGAGAGPEAVTSGGRWWPLALLAKCNFQKLPTPRGMCCRFLEAPPEKDSPRRRAVSCGAVPGRAARGPPARSGLVSLRRSRPAPQGTFPRLHISWAVFLPRGPGGSSCPAAGKRGRRGWAVKVAIGRLSGEGLSLLFCCSGVSGAVGLGVFP